jgi:hypothetical protein
VWLCGYVGRVLAERLRAAVCVGWLRAERIRPAGTVRPILGSDCTAEHRYECPSVQPAIHRCSNTFASDEQPITSSWNYRLRARMIWSYGARPSCTAEFGLSDAKVASYSIYACTLRKRTVRAGVLESSQLTQRLHVCVLPRARSLSLAVCSTGCRRRFLPVRRNRQQLPILRRRWRTIDRRYLRRLASGSPYLWRCRRSYFRWLWWGGSCRRRWSLWCSRRGQLPSIQPSIQPVVAWTV